MAKYRVTLAVEERDELRTLIQTGKGAARKLNHARILLLADEGELGPGKTDSMIADALETSHSTIERVRKRLVEEGLEQALDPKPRPKRPSQVKIQGRIEEQLIEVASSDPPEGRGRWTLELLADQLVVLSSLESVSRETVRKTLKKTTSTLLQ